MDLMRIGFVQNHPVFGEVEANVDAALALAAAAPARLLVFPELFATGYQFRSAEELASLAEPSEGPTCRRLAEFCRREQCFVVAGFPEATSGGVFNSAAIVGPDGLVDVYRKSHLFAEEKRWFSPGDTGFRVVTVDGCRIGVLVCFDWAFPEAARTLALSGAEILVHPANLVLPFGQRALWTRSVENRVFSLTANRIGIEERTGGRLEFTGQSQVVSPRGEVLAQAPADLACARSVEVDLALARDKHATPWNDLFSDRRPDLYRL